MNRAKGIGPVARISSRMRSRSAASSPTSLRSVGGSRRSPGRMSSITTVSSRRSGRSASRRPGPTSVCPPSRTGIGASAAARVSACSHGSAMRSWSRRSEAWRSSADGQRPSSAPRRWARSTRLSMMAASPRRARCSPSDDGPSRSSRAPSTLAAGRWPDWLVRIPRSSMMARVRAAPDRSSHASAAGEVRPATTTSAAPSATTLRIADEPRLDALAVGGGQPAGPSVAEEHEVERPVDVDAQPPSLAQVGDRHARDLVEPARQHVVARQIREAGEGVAGAGDGHDVGRVAVVRERARSIRGGGRDEGSTVCRAQERDRARAQDDEPARSGVIEQAPEPGAEGRVVRGPGERRGRGQRPRRGTRLDAVPRGRPGRRPRRGRAARRRVPPPGGGSRRTRRSGAVHPPPDSKVRPMSDRTATRRVRAYIGLGANVGDAPATLAWAVDALAGLPGVRLRGVSPLYVTAPWGVTDQPDFHNAVVAVDVPAGPDPAAGAIALLGRAQEAGTPRRTPRPRALGSTRARPRPAGVRAAPDRGRPAGRARARSKPRPTRPRPPAASRSRIATPGSGCSCWRRSPTSRRGWCHPAGARPSKRAGDAWRPRRQPDAVRRIARWHADPGQLGPRAGLGLTAYDRVSGTRMRDGAAHEEDP